MYLPAGASEFAGRLLKIISAQIDEKRIMLTSQCFGGLNLGLRITRMLEGQAIHHIYISITYG